MSILEVHDLKKIYTSRFGTQQVEALRRVSFSVERGEYVAVMGETVSTPSSSTEPLVGLSSAASRLSSVFSTTCMSGASYGSITDIWQATTQTDTSTPLPASVRTTR